MQREPEKRGRFVDTECQNTVNKKSRVDLADSLRLLNKIGDEAELLLEHRRLQEKEVWNIFEHQSHRVLGAHGEEHGFHF